MSIAAFQRALADTLASSALGEGPGLAVHRNNVMVGCIDALGANFPTIERLVGAEFFRAMAAEFARVHLPTRPSLFDYGVEFADFIAHFPPAASLPYLADVARIDRGWIEAHVAADAPMLRGADLAKRDPASLDSTRLRLHPTVRVGWFDQPIVSIWRRNRESAVDAGELAWLAEGALVVRPNDDVEVHRIGAATYAFVLACANDGTLTDATADAFAAEPDVDLAAAFARLVGTGVFTALEE